MVAKLTPIFPTVESMMKPETLQRARQRAEQEILAIKLANLRERRGVKQSEISGFTQTAVSRLERRHDIKVSTLISYLDGLGMGLEIRAFAKEKAHDAGEVLLRI